MRMLSIKECGSTSGGLYHDPFMDYHFEAYLSTLSPQQRMQVLERQTLVYGTSLGALLGGMGAHTLISTLTLCPFLVGSAVLLSAACGGYALYAGISYLQG